MSRWLKSLLIVPVVASVVGGCAGAGKKDQVTYEGAPVERRDVRSFVTATGIIQPWKIVDIKSNVGGRIDRLAVDLGTRVKKGDPIMVIDPTDTKAERDQAQADLGAAHARREQARVNLDQQRLQQKARVAAALKAVEASKARLAQTKASRDVQPKLWESSLAQAKAALVSAEKAVNQAEKSKKQLQEQFAQLRSVTIPLNIETVENNVAQAKASMQTAELDYRRQRNLLAEGYVARGELEASQARLATARSSLRTLEQRKSTLVRENQIQIQEMTARIEEADSRIEDAQARVEQARANLKLAEDNRFQVDVRSQEYQAAAAGVAQARADLQSAYAEAKQIEVRQREITAAASTIVRNQAALSRAEMNLGFTRIDAPRSGVIITKNVEEGTIIPSSRASIGSTNALIQIGDISRLWIVCNVDETDIGQVNQGQKVTVKVDAYPSMLIDGKVIRIDPQAKVEQNVTLIPVTVEIDLPDERFKPGMNAECEFIVDEATNVLTVPNEALKENEGTFTVQKMVNGKPSEPIQVEVGLAGQDATEVRSGVQEGDEVLVRTIEPEKPTTTNPFGSPFGGAGGGNRGGGGGGGRPGGGGGGR